MLEVGCRKLRGGSGAHQWHAEPQPVNESTTTPAGAHLQYYLKMEPELFKGAVESQLQRMREEKEAKEAAAKEQEEKAKQGDAKELTLYKYVAAEHPFFLPCLQCCQPQAPPADRL
jgi:hypothetical protein